jgi:hypothetical protein
MSGQKCANPTCIHQLENLLYVNTLNLSANAEEEEHIASSYGAWQQFVVFKERVAISLSVPGWHGLVKVIRSQLSTEN